MQDACHGAVRGSRLTSDAGGRYTMGEDGGPGASGLAGGIGSPTEGAAGHGHTKGCTGQDVRSLLAEQQKVKQADRTLLQGSRGLVVPP